MFSYRARPMSFLEVEGAKDVGVEVHSMSKGWHMIGWRLGWVCGNERIVHAFADVKDNSDSGQFLAIQKAAVVALDDDSSEGRIAIDVESRLIAVFVDARMNFVARDIHIVSVGPHGVMRAVADEIVRNGDSASVGVNGGRVDAVDSAEVADEIIVDDMPRLRERIAVARGDPEASAAEFPIARIQGTAVRALGDNNRVSSELFRRASDGVAAFAVLKEAERFSAELKVQVAQYDVGAVFQLKEPFGKFVEFDVGGVELLRGRYFLRGIEIDESGDVVDVIFAGRVELFENVRKVIGKSSGSAFVIESNFFLFAVDLNDLAEIGGPFPFVQAERPDSVEILPAVGPVVVVFKGRGLFVVRFDLFAEFPRLGHRARVCDSPPKYRDGIGLALSPSP